METIVEVIESRKHCPIAKIEVGNSNKRWEVPIQAKLSMAVLLTLLA
jgi:hypothetical protein